MNFFSRSPIETALATRAKLADRLAEAERTAATAAEAVAEGDDEIAAASSASAAIDTLKAALTSADKKVFDETVRVAREKLDAERVEGATILERLAEELDARRADAIALVAKVEAILPKLDAVAGSSYGGQAHDVWNAVGFFCAREAEALRERARAIRHGSYSWESYLRAAIGRRITVVPEREVA